jgi:hypothetical protein
LSGKKISDLSPVPSNTPASQLSLETAREISPGVWAGESERIKASDFVALLAAAGASLSVNITSLLNDRGTYSPSGTYTRYDFVAYGGGHYAYVNGTPGSGNAPPNVAYWVLISVDGKSAIATITDATPAAIPAIGSQATYGVDSSAGMVVGQIIGIGAASTLSVVSTPTTASITVQNVNAAVGPVVTGAKIAPAGKKGDPGLNSTVAGPAGENAFTTVTTAFTIPAFNAQVSATVGSTAFMSVGMALQIGGVFFKVAAAPTNATTVSLTNSVAGQSGTIAATSKVVVSGEAGPAGTPGTSGGGVSGLQYTNLNTAGTPTAGQIRSADINYVGASPVTISPTDAQTTPQSTADVLARLKVGAIIEIAASNANKVRGTISANYSSGTNSFDWSGQIVSGSIANNTTVYLSIVSDPVSAASGGGQVQDEGVDLPQRGKTNFVGAGVTATDDAAGDRTVITIAGGGSASIVEETGSSATILSNTIVVSNSSSPQTLSLTGASGLVSVQGKGAGIWSLRDGVFFASDGASNNGVRRKNTHRYASIDLVNIGSDNWAIRNPADMTGIELYAIASGDPRVIDYVAAMTGLGVVLTATELAAYQSALAAIDAVTTWANVKCWYPMLGGTLASCAIDAKDPSSTTQLITWGNASTVTAQGVETSGDSRVPTNILVPSASSQLSVGVSVSGVDFGEYPFRSFGDDLVLWAYYNNIWSATFFVTKGGDPAWPVGGQRVTGTNSVVLSTQPAQTCRIVTPTENISYSPDRLRTGLNPAQNISLGAAMTHKAFIAIGSANGLTLAQDQGIAAMLAAMQTTLGR